MVDHDLTFFQSIPWCATILNDPRHVIITTKSRQIKENGEDALLAETLKTDQTIPAWLSLYKKPANPHARIEELMTFLSLESGINGYPQVCHGGIVATILDEVLGILLTVNKDWKRDTASSTTLLDERMATVTAELTVKYLKPVATPQTVCVKAWFSKIEGRKLCVHGVIEDKAGTALAKGEAVFVQTRRESL